MQGWCRDGVQGWGAGNGAGDGDGAGMVQRGAAEVLRLWRCGADEVVSEEVVQRQRWCRGMGGAEAWVVQRWWWC